MKIQKHLAIVSLILSLPSMGSGQILSGDTEPAAGGGNFQRAVLRTSGGVQTFSITRLDDDFEPEAGVMFLAHDAESPSWMWAHKGGSQNEGPNEYFDDATLQMFLSDINVLSLFDPSSQVTPTIQLDPRNSGSILIDGSDVVTEASGSDLYLPLAGNGGGSSSFQLGPGSDASSNYSVAIGNSAEAGYGSAAFGFNTTASGYYSLASGYNSIASSTGAVALGHSTEAGIISFAAGYQTDATGYNSSALGWYTRATGSHSTAVGRSTTAFGTSSFAAGYNTLAEGDYSAAIGEGTTASGTRAFATGENTLASGFSTLTSGNQTKATGSNSAAFGYLSEANASGGFAAGRTISNGYYGFTVGRHNENVGETGGAVSSGWSTLNPAFEVGISNSSSDRKTGLATFYSGKTVLTHTDFDEAVSVEDLPHALEVRGAAAVAGSIEVGGNLTVGGTVEFSGTLSTARIEIVPNEMTGDLSMGSFTAHPE